jgi:copper oxidase (laccase) domain-containing protein
MQEQYGSNIRQIAVFIGPGIDRCCFEIQRDLAEKAKLEFDGYANIISRGGDRLFWDLKDTIRQELLLLGVPAGQIQVCELCTCCRSDLFYSYRRDNGDTGRMGAFISLNGLVDTDG